MMEENLTLHPPEPLLSPRKEKSRSVATGGRNLEKPHFELQMYNRTRDKRHISDERLSVIRTVEVGLPGSLAVPVAAAHLSRVKSATKSGNNRASS